MSEKVYIFLPSGVKFSLDLEDLDGDDVFVDTTLQPGNKTEAYYVRRFLSALQQTSGMNC